jgi:hypothetical protein
LHGTLPGRLGSTAFGSSEQFDGAASGAGEIGVIVGPRFSERPIIAPPMYRAAGGCVPSAFFGGMFGSMTIGASVV